MTQPFYFPNGQLANNADDLFELCQQYPDDATNYLARGDLENWLAYIGSYEFAECATNARQKELSDRQKLEEFLNNSHSLTVEDTIPAAVIETQIEDNLTAPPTTTPDVLSEEPADDSASVATDLPMSATLTDTTEIPQEVSEPTPATPPEKPAESVRSAEAEDSQTSSSSSEEANSSEEKPSFFQVIAKFIVKILYRNKA